MHVTVHPYSTRRKGRATRLTCYETLKLPALRSVWLLSIVPAFLFSCISPEESVPDRKQTQIYITKAEKTTVGGMDLFFFRILCITSIIYYEISYFVAFFICRFLSDQIKLQI